MQSSKSRRIEAEGDYEKLEHFQKTRSKLNRHKQMYRSRGRYHTRPKVLYSTVQWTMLIFVTGLIWAVFYCTELKCAVLYCTRLKCALLYCSKLKCALFYCPRLKGAILNGTGLTSAVFYYNGHTLLLSSVLDWNVFY